MPAVEEITYERRLTRIAARRRLLAEREAELARLKGALSRFTAHCEARIGDLLAELRRVNRAIADYERRLQRLDEYPRPDELPPDLAEDEPDPAAWDEPASSVDAEDHVPPPHQTPPPRPRLDKQTETETKRLYRALAKRCHPDRAASTEDRVRRVEMMQRVNEAFRDRDLSALRALDRASRADDPAFARRPVSERLAWARAELTRLDSQLAAVAREIGWMRGTEAHRLWRRSEAGEDVFQDLEDILEARLAVEGRRLDRLSATYRRRVDMREPAATTP